MVETSDTDYFAFFETVDDLRHYAVDDYEAVFFIHSAVLGDLRSNVF